MRTSIYVATPNIAVVKYWGRKKGGLNIPLNSSISVTMDEKLLTTTSVAFVPKLKNDCFFLNGKKAAPEELLRVKKVLDIVRKKAGIKEKARVVSENNFPTAAGIASSASGFAALACAACDAAGFKASKRELSIFARLGSGSACRSVMGGFVEWKKGSKKDGSDSYAVQIAPASHWPELRNVIAIADSKRKKIGSEKGMQITVATSKLYKKRIKKMPKTVLRMRKAILGKDLEEFLFIAMNESDSMHETMKDSKPSIVYLNKVSKKIISAVKDFNRKKGIICAGYTFDAGPNAHIYTVEKHVPEVKRMLKRIRGVKKVIACKIGQGPRKLTFS